MRRIVVFGKTFKCILQSVAYLKLILFNEIFLILFAGIYE